MQVQVKSWGNGQGIRLSKDVLNTLDIHLNDYLMLKIEDDSIVLSKTFKHKTLEERVLEAGSSIGPYTEFGWDETKGREFW